MANPLPSSAFTETPSFPIHTCSQTVLPVVSPNSNLATLSPEKNLFIFKAVKVDIICTPRHFFFFANYNHLFREQKQFPNIFLLQWRCFRLQGREGQTHRGGTVEGMWHTQQRRADWRGSALLRHYKPLWTAVKISVKTNITLNQETLLSSPKTFKSRLALFIG